MWPEIIGRNKQSCQKKQSDYDNNDCFWRVFGRGYEKLKIMIGSERLKPKSWPRL
jgi:hypothetical protein